MIIQEVADEVLEAFREQGLTPVQACWIYREGDNPCVCAIGGLMAKRVGFDDLYESYYEREFVLFSVTQIDVMNELDERYGKDFAEGVVAGFDGTNLKDDDYDFEGYNIEYYSNGYDTGKYIWNKLNSITA